MNFIGDQLTGIWDVNDRYDVLHHLYEFLSNCD